MFFRLLAASLGLVSQQTEAPVLDTVPPELPALRHPAVLVFSKTNAWRHDSIPAMTGAIVRLVERHGWSAYATENGAVFNPVQLAKFDVIVLASATGDLFGPEQREAFRGFVARGGGIVALHGSGDSSQPWPWYLDRIIGTRFIGHPGGKDQFQTATLVVTDRTHPATRTLPATWRWTDEYYSFDAPQPADAHLLARLDETGMALEPKLVMGNKHPMIWWRCAGRARIFYSALGHRIEAWSDPVHLGMVDGAITWAMRKAGRGC